MNSIINEQIWNAYILREGVEEFKKQAQNILKNNNIEDAESVVDKLQNVIEDVERDIENDIKNLVKGDHIVALAFIYLNGLTNFDVIKEEYRSYIDTYTLSKNNVLSTMAKDILQEIKSRKLFKDVDEKMRLIRQKVNEFISELHSLQGSGEKDEKKVAGSENIDEQDIVYDDENILVVLADSRLKCIKYGNPNLCISWTGARNYYWAYRMGKYRADNMGMTTYFVINKSDGDKYLIDVLGDEDGPNGGYSWNPIHPNNDTDISKEDLINKFPELKPAFEKGAFKFLPYSDMEERFSYIDESIDSITDDRLKTKEDYWMFIESGKKIEPDEWDKIPKGIRNAAIEKYISVGENFNVPDEMFEDLSPTLKKNYDMKILRRAKEYFSSI